MTVAEFLDWPGDRTGTRYELVNGEPRAMAPASITHGIIQGNAARLLGSHLLGTRCRLVIAPGVVPRARSDMNFRIPDLAVDCAAHEAGRRALPEPMLILEILSPSNEAETWDNVWAYTTIPSVREILLLHSTRIAAELLRRQPDGNWPERAGIIGPTDEIELASIDYRGPLRDFYTETLLRGP